MISFNNIKLLSKMNLIILKKLFKSDFFECFIILLFQLFVNNKKLDEAKYWSC